MGKPSRYSCRNDKYNLSRLTCSSGEEVRFLRGKWRGEIMKRGGPKIAAKLNLNLRKRENIDVTKKEALRVNTNSNKSRWLLLFRCRFLSSDYALEGSWSLGKRTITRIWLWGESIAISSDESSRETVTSIGTIFLSREESRRQVIKRQQIVRFFKFHFLRFVAEMINEASPIDEYFNINEELERIEAWHFFGNN